MATMCRECKALPEIGSCCIYHYVRRFARRVKLDQYEAYLAREPIFIEALQMRYYVLTVDGHEVSPVDVVVGIFLRGAVHFYKTSPALADIRRIVEAVDEAGRRKHAVLTGSEANRE